MHDLERFPRDREHIPDWLAARLAQGRALIGGTFDDDVWMGARFQAAFTVDGQDTGTSDFRPHPSAARWAEEVIARLRQAGVVAVAVQGVASADDAADDVLYPEVEVVIGSGACSLSFWADQVWWSADVWDNQADRATAQHVLDLVRRTVQDVTGWRLVLERVSDGYTHVLVGLGPTTAP